MAKPFAQIKTTELSLTDKLTIGKFRGCRLCDIVEDEYEYLIWLEKSGMVKYSKEVIAKIHKIANFVEAKVHYQNEVKPYLDEDTDDVPY
jgi:uncharacterized protein (DUF3820 family)